MTAPNTGIDPVPASAWPSLTPVSSTTPPAMPPAWSATVLLHPFSPPQTNDLNPTTPFFELCVASLRCIAGVYFSAQITGCTSGKTWSYRITPQGTQLWNGSTWGAVNMGWSLPTNWFGAGISQAACAGSSPLNWMNTQPVDWWKAPVPNTNPPGATWAWFDSNSGAPVRMMFGVGPLAGPNMGDPAQLAVLQMYSFTYFASYKILATDDAALPRTLEELQASTPAAASISGFTAGNPKGYQNFVWNGNFGMTAFMTPVNEEFNPLPTRVLYVWKPDSQYSVYSDRAQNTLMNFEYNSGDHTSQEALLTGMAPSGMPPPANSDTSFLIDCYSDKDPTCAGPNQGFDFPQQPPNWVSIPAVQGSIQATIENNPVLAPNTVVTIFSVLFPPSPPNYPDSTYLWTWYAPQSSSGTESRPVAFMQSQSGVGVGTSLALADYFYYQNFSTPIDPSNFAIPSQCAIASAGDKAHRRRTARPMWPTLRLRY